jgi:hypothetical protein
MRRSKERFIVILFSMSTAQEEPKDAPQPIFGVHT